MIAQANDTKNVVVILNGISRRRKFFYKSIFPALSRICKLQVWETKSKDDAIALASKATSTHADLILAAGGDGTLNQVVNGVLRANSSERKRPVIGVIPIGSGNDFARTVGARADARYLTALITNFNPKNIDVGLVEFTDNNTVGTRYFVNVADLGMGPVVVDKVVKSKGLLGRGIAYYMSILSTFFSYKPMHVKAETTDWTWKGRLRTLGVANGKFYGHGLCIAPDAIVADRIFEVFICGNVTVLDFMLQTSNLKKGKFISLPDVHYKRATMIKLSSDAPCLIEADGEILGHLPAAITLSEKQLEFLI